MDSLSCFHVCVVSVSVCSRLDYCKCLKLYSGTARNLCKSPNTNHPRNTALPFDWSAQIVFFSFFLAFSFLPAAPLGWMQRPQMDGTLGKHASSLFYVPLRTDSPSGKKERKKKHAPPSKRKRPNTELDLCAQVLWANQHSIDTMACLKWDGKTDTWLDILGMNCRHMAVPQHVSV